MRHYEEMVAIAVCTLAALTVMPSSVLSVIAIPGGEYVCKPLETEASLSEEVEWRENIASSDNKALASMVGYLHIYNEGYIPIVLREFDTSGEYNLVFKSECATISWMYGLTQNPPAEISLQAISVGLPFKRRNSDQVKIKPICTVRSVHGEYHSDKRFLCDQRIKLPCLAPKDINGQKNQVGELVFDLVEFELHGNVTRIENGRFSAYPLPRSCNILQGDYYK